MAKANNTNIYKYDEYPSLLDYLFGSDFEDYNKNKSFRLNSIIQLINGVNGKNNLQFIFSDGADPTIDYYDKGCFFTDTNSGDPTAFTKLILNKSSLQPVDLTLLFQRLDELQDVVLKLENPVNPNNFFNFRVLAIDDQTDYFVFDVEVFKDFYFGTFLTDTVYSIYFDIKSATDSDPLKLDKSTYAGNAQDIDDRIVVLENLQDLNTNFTGQAFAVWTGVGYKYDVIYPDYYIQGVLYPGGTIQKTLAISDDTHSRFDVFYVNALGVQIKTGIAAANPLIPTIDTEMELFITSQLVVALSVVPEDSTLTQVYDENLEWTATSNNSSAVNFNSTGTPYKGVKHGDIGAFVLGQSVKFTNSDTLSVLNYTTLKFAINLKGNFGKTKKILVQFMNGSTVVSSGYYFGAGQNNFVHNIIDVYQLIAIDFSSFTFNQTAFDSISINFGSANSFGFRIDDVALVKGSSVIAPTQKAITSIVTDNGIANATIKDDTFQFKGGNGAVVSAAGKEITITPANQTKTQVGLGNVDNTSDVNKPVSTAQQNALDLKLDTSSYNQHFKGKYTSSGALTTAHPTATDGDYAIVDSGTGVDAKEWIWDNEAGWIVGGATGASTTDALPEGSTNLYWTVARFFANLTATNIKTALGITTLSGDNTGDQDLSGKQDTLVSGTTIKTINGASVLGSGDIAIVGGGGDMVLASDQTVSGLKTFLAGKFGLRNVANTFTSFFTNANTAARTYTLQNRDGTLADNTDLATKMANPTGGIASYLPKFLTATTMGLSRLWDTGTFFGIGTVNAPTKDLTFGNQANREIGIEEGDAVTKGRNLTLSAGITNDYNIISTFVAQGTGITSTDITISASGDIYLLKNTGDILKQIGGGGDFISSTPNIIGFNDIAIHPNGNMYAIKDGSSSALYMQTNGIGNFSVTYNIGYIRGLTIAPNGDVYVCGWFNGDIYKQTNGTGNFNSLSQTGRQWRDMCASPNGDIYACVEGGDIYKQTGGTGSFVATGQTARNWIALTAAPNGSVYCAVSGGDVYRQSGGVGGFVPLSQVSRSWTGLDSSSDGNIYGVAGDLYFMDMSAKGSPNLDGGTLKHKAGTGKGNGKSRQEFYTGQKTVSGTDMQVETLRMEVNEIGEVTLPSTTIAIINTEITGKQVATTEWVNSKIIQPIINISGTYSLSNADNGRILVLTASCTVTVPDGLTANFECTLVTLAGATLTTSLGSLVTLINNTGTTMAEKLSVTLKNTLTTDQYLSTGNL